MKAMGSKGIQRWKEGAALRDQKEHRKKATSFSESRENQIRKGGSKKKREKKKCAKQKKKADM